MIIRKSLKIDWRVFLTKPKDNKKKYFIVSLSANNIQMYFT